MQETYERDPPATIQCQRRNTLSRRPYDQNPPRNDPSRPHRTPEMVAVPPRHNGAVPPGQIPWGLPRAEALAVEEQ